jgi:alpha/beta superfamily hydrolase
LSLAFAYSNSCFIPFSQYIKHIAFRLAKEGWNVVVQNHRGLGGISLTSDCVYTAGWTEDLRKVIAHIHSQFPEAPLFAVGTSIGANVLVYRLFFFLSLIPLILHQKVEILWQPLFVLKG